MGRKESKQTICMYTLHIVRYLMLKVGISLKGAISWFLLNSQCVVLNILLHVLKVVIADDEGDKMINVSEKLTINDVFSCATPDYWTAILCTESHPYFCVEHIIQQESKNLLFIA